MEKLQRFGGAMMPPVMLMPFAGIMIGLATIFMSQDIMGPLASDTTLWYKIWSMLYDGGYAIFNQLPLLFAISLPLGLTNKASGKAAMESFVIFITFNYFIQSLLTSFGVDVFGVDFTQEVGGTSGLTMVANIKTLDTSVIGAIAIGAISAWIHNHFYEKQLPDFLKAFQSSALVVIIGFVLMIPAALLTCLIWPKVQLGILSLQDFLASAGSLGVFLYTFLERITIPTGLHHFLWVPFDLGPAAIADGNWTHWLAHINEYAASTEPLKTLFPTGGFALYGNCAVWGAPAIAFAFYKTARPENRKKVAAMLISAVIPAVLCGITEPLEFMFLFISPALFAVSALLAAALSTTLYIFGVVGYQGAGLIDYITINWVPMFPNHPTEVITHIVIGLIFMVIYFVVFYAFIKHFNVPTPGREVELPGADAPSASIAAPSAGSNYAEQAAGFLEALGGAANIESVTNCMTRLRVKVHDEAKVEGDDAFRAFNARGVVRNGQAIQVIIGFDVENVKQEFEKLL